LFLSGSHCQRLNEVLDEATNVLSGEVLLAKVDCTKEDVLAKRFDIQAYPTLKL
jgi:thioredoxin-like negative regulator of GroEL